MLIDENRGRTTNDNADVDASASKVLAKVVLWQAIGWSVVIGCKTEQRIIYRSTVLQTDAW